MITARTYVCGSACTVRRLNDLTGSWTDVSLVPGGISGINSLILHDIETDPTNGNKVITVGEQNAAANPNYFGIAVSVNQGVSWTIPTGNYTTLINLGFIPVFRELTYVDTNTIYACEENGYVVKSTDGGLSFNVCSPLSLAVVVAQSIHFATSLVGVVGGNDAAYKTIDGGITWTDLNGGQTFSFTGNTIGLVVGIMMQPDLTTITVFGEQGNAVSYNGGATFPTVPSGSAVSPFPITGIGRHLTWYNNGTNTITGTNNIGERYTGFDGYTSGGLVTNNGAINGQDVLAAHYYLPNSGFISAETGGSSQIYKSSDDFGTLLFSDSWSSLSAKAVWTHYIDTPDPVCYLLTHCLNQTTIITSTNLSLQVGQVITINEQSGCFTVSVALECIGAIPVGLINNYVDCASCSPPPSGCYCPPGYTLNPLTGYCESIISTPAIINNPTALVAAFPNLSNTIWGAVLYPSIDTTVFPITNNPIIGVPISPPGSGIAPYLSYPELLDGSLAPIPIQGTIAPYVGNTTWGWTSPGPIPPLNTLGRLNVAGIWPPFGYPDNVWWGIDFCVNIPATKSYIIGVAGDDAYKLWINNVLIVDTSSAPYSFLTWALLPITLTAGNNTFKLEAFNAGSDKAAALEIYDATFAQLQAVTSAGFLNPYIVYSTANLVGANITQGENTGYSCAQGSNLNICNQPPTCDNVTIVAPEPCCYQLTECAPGTGIAYTGTDLSTYMQGVIIQVAEYPGKCWSVSLSNQACPGAPAVSQIVTFADCQACLPVIPPPVQPPFSLKPRMIKPGYTTPGCSPEYTEHVSCTFGTQVYDDMIRKRYGITVCCDVDVDKWDIKKQLLDLRALYDPELCKCAFARCIPPCAVEAVLVVYNPLPACIPPTNVVADLVVIAPICPPPINVQAGLSIP